MDIKCLGYTPKDIFLSNNAPFDPEIPVFHFRVLGISRLCLQEFVRHTHGVGISVKSTRFTLQELKKERSFNKKTYNISGASKYIVFPGQEEFEDPWDMEKHMCKQVDELEILRQHIKEGYKRDIAKYLVPESYKTSLTWTVRFSTLNNFFKLRIAKDAHFEIRDLAQLILKRMPSEYIEELTWKIK